MGHTLLKYLVMDKVKQQLTRLRFQTQTERNISLINHSTLVMEHKTRHIELQTFLIFKRLITSMEHILVLKTISMLIILPLYLTKKILQYQLMATEGQFIILI